MRHRKQKIKLKKVQIAMSTKPNVLSLLFSFFFFFSAKYPFFHYMIKTFRRIDCVFSFSSFFSITEINLRNPLSCKDNSVFEEQKEEQLWKNNDASKIVNSLIS